MNINIGVSNHVQILMLNKSIGADFYILMHKRNAQHDTWYHLTMEGAADQFSKKFPKIEEYWKTFLKAYESVCTYMHMIWHINIVYIACVL